MWNRAPSWPGSAARSDFLGNATPVPSDPALGRADTPDPYGSGQFLPALAPVPTAPEADQIRTDAYVAPYTGPLDLDDYGRETDEMRRAYRDLHRKEPAVRSAVDGKAASVAALDLVVKPRDKTKPNDLAAANFVKEQIEQSEHGADGLILNMLRAAFIDGWSVLEKTLRAVPGPTGPRWGLLHCKSRDTAHLRLRLDGYRNVLGVVNTVRGIRTHDPAKVILFTHADLFSNPYGQSDLRAAYRSAQLINDAYQLWHVAVKVFGGPFLKGKVGDSARRKQMETALRAARAAGFIVTPEEDDVEVLNMASATSFDAFEKKVRIHREEIYLAVRHAYMPFMQSSSGGADQRGDTGVNKHAGSDPVEYLLAKAVGRVLSHQLVPDLVVPNFPAGTGLPIVQLGGVNWGETKAQLDIAATLKEKWGLDVSAEYLFDVTQMPPPKGPTDTPPGPNGGGGAPGGAPPAGAPANPTPGAPPAVPSVPGGPAPTPVDAGAAPQAAPAAPASAFSADQAPKYASYFAPSRHGHYPGNLHEEFGLGVAQFATATGLLRRQVRRAGTADWVWAPPPVPPQPPPAVPPAPIEFALGAPVPVPVALLGTDPQRLQWRAGAGADGTVRPLPAERYDPSKGGTLLGWRDPASGRALVVEGHHRLAHAKRDGVKSVPVRFVSAPDADAAREIGRRANERGAAFASEHADGEEWVSNGRRYNRTGGETVRVASTTEQGGPSGGSAAPAQPQPASPPPPAAPPAPEVPPEVRAAGESIAQELAGDPEAVKPGVLGRLKGLALDAAIKVYSVAARIQDSRVGGLVATALDAYFDSPKDLEKLGYNPTNSSGGAGPQVLDPVKEATADALGVGISGHLAAKVAAVAVTKALFWLKGKLGGKADGAQMAALDPTGEMAAALADLFDAANASVGLGPVDRAAVAATVARLGAKQFATGHQEGERWTTGDRTYKREGGETVRVAGGGADVAGDSKGSAGPTDAPVSGSDPSPPSEGRPAAPVQYPERMSKPPAPIPLPQNLNWNHDPDPEGELATRRAVVKVFGSDILGGFDTLPKEHLAAMGNAVDGATVTVRAYHFAPDTVSIHTESKAGSALRNYSLDKNGRIVVKNNVFRYDKDLAGPGAPTGAELLFRQVSALTEQWGNRLSHIETHAAGSAKGKSDGFVGFKVWPVLGYDGTIPKRLRDKLPPEIKAAMGDSKSVLDLHQVPGGREWWAANGVALDMKFDLAPGSKSRRVLEAYIARKRGEQK